MERQDSQSKYSEFCPGLALTAAWQVPQGPPCWAPGSRPNVERAAQLSAREGPTGLLGVALGVVRAQRGAA